MELTDWISNLAVIIIVCVYALLACCIMAIVCANRDEQHESLLVDVEKGKTVTEKVSKSKAATYGTFNLIHHHHYPEIASHPYPYPYHHHHHHHHSARVSR